MVLPRTRTSKGEFTEALDKKISTKQAEKDKLKWWAGIVDEVSFGSLEIRNFALKL